ncbi:MAG: hypothetical protein JZD40_03855 [Sulfolobus sp.]|nr:hypothetical protein [Sulfolobus sp.]
MALTQAILAFGLPIIIFVGLTYAAYKIINSILPHIPTPIKIARFEAANIPTGLGRLWYPLQYYGYVIIYTSLEPFIVVLFVASEAAYYSSFEVFRNLLILITTFIAILYPVLYYSIKQVDNLKYWVFEPLVEVGQNVKSA